MKNKYRKLSLVLLLIASPAVLTGCLAAAAVGGGAVAGAGTIAYIKEFFFKASYNDPWNPVKTSVKAKEMGL